MRGPGWAMETAQAMDWGLVWATGLALEQEWVLVSARELWGLALAREMESASAQGMVWEPVTGWGLWGWC